MNNSIIAMYTMIEILAYISLHISFKSADNAGSQKVTIVRAPYNNIIVNTSSTRNWMLFIVVLLFTYVTDSIGN